MKKDGEFTGTSLDKPALGAKIVNQQKKYEKVQKN